MKISLKTKLMTIFFILIVLPMSLLGIVSYNMTSKSLQEITSEELVAQATDTAEIIEISIDTVKSILENTSLNTQVSDVIKNKTDVNIDIIFNYLNNIKKYNEEFIEELIITDNTGKVIVDTKDKKPDIDLSDRDYIKQIMSTGESTVSEVLTSEFSGNPAIFIGYPIKSNDEIIGIVVGSVKFDSISKYVSRIKVGKNGYGYMIDKNGLIISHPNEELVLSTNISNISNSKDYLKIIKSMKNGESGSGFYKDNGVSKYITFEGVEHWCIAIEVENKDYMSAAIDIRKDTIIFTVITIIIAMIVSYIYATKDIVNPIKKLQKLMKLAGEGDLSVQSDIRSKDEIEDLGYSFNIMVNEQKEIIRNIQVASKQLNDEAENMAASLEEVSATTEEISAAVIMVEEKSDVQNNSIIDASTVIVQLSSLVELAKNRAEATNEDAISSKIVADLGRSKVQETVKAMNSINNESSQAGKVLEEVSELSSKVGGIVTTINTIADQTNLLALNAAIEAARAGEEGKGFSIVADEVRKLAEETNSNAQEINILVSEMISKTQNAVNAMERAKCEVEGGVEIVSETDKAFINIIKSIERIVEHIKEILNITNEEVSSSDKVIALIDKIASATEDNVANCKSVSIAIQEDAEAINNITASAEETSAMAEQLMRSVEKFIIEVKDNE